MDGRRGFSFFRTLFQSIKFLLCHFHEFLLIAIPLLLIYAALCIWVGYPLTGSAEFGLSFFPMHQILPGFMGWVLIAILAVRWHRRVLIGPFDRWTAYVPLLGRRELQFLLLEILIMVMMIFFLLPFIWLFPLIGSAMIRDFGQGLDIVLLIAALGVGSAAAHIAVTFAIASVFLVFPMIATDRPASWSMAALLLEGYGVRTRLLLAIASTTLATGLLIGSFRVDTRGGGGIRLSLYSGQSGETLAVATFSHSLELLAAAFCATVFSLTYKRMTEIKQLEEPTPSAAPA